MLVLEPGPLVRAVHVVAIGVATESQIVTEVCTVVLIDDRRQHRRLAWCEDPAWLTVL
ncbi:MAG: hypothetical protein ACRDQ5_25595 [Sciscionella sp.]